MFSGVARLFHTDPGYSHVSRQCPAPSEVFWATRENLLEKHVVWDALEMPYLLLNGGLTFITCPLPTVDLIFWKIFITHLIYYKLFPNLYSQCKVVIKTSSWCNSSEEIWVSPCYCGESKCNFAVRIFEIPLLVLQNLSVSGFLYWALLPSSESQQATTPASNLPHCLFGERGFHWSPATPILPHCLGCFQQPGQSWDCKACKG